MVENLQNLYEKLRQTISLYPEQLKQAWEEVRALEIPGEFASVKNIVFCGMGGSALGARIVKAYAQDILDIPFEIYTDYNLPNYADEESLVICSSYSGTTEETVNCAKQAIEKNANTFFITTGGDLAKLASENNIPTYTINPAHNPSEQPRNAIGYAAGAVLGLFAKIGFIPTGNAEIESAVTSMKDAVAKSDEGANGEAQKLSSALVGKIPILVASEHMLGIAHTIKNQFNESAKTFSALFDLPELNHHLLEGLANPPENKNLLYFIFFNSNLYSPRVEKRYPLTLDVVKQNNVPAYTYLPSSNDKLSQIFETLVFGSFTVYHLTKSYAINPIEIPWVDYFKNKLKEA
jgi:glucose/mannose-6-phosphate isomerase